MKSAFFILKQLQKGNQLAFRELYSNFSTQVYQLAFNILREVIYAEEIVQDTFLEVWNGRQNIDCDANIEAYLYVICRNKSFNKLKQIKREQALFAPLQECNNPSSDAEENNRKESELREQLEIIIQKLPDRRQLIFRRSRLEGFSHKEIALDLDISVQTVKNQMATALKFIRDELQKDNKNFTI